MSFLWISRFFSCFARSISAESRLDRSCPSFAWSSSQCRSCSLQSYSLSESWVKSCCSFLRKSSERSLHLWSSAYVLNNASFFLLKSLSLSSNYLSSCYYLPCCSFNEYCASSYCCCFLEILSLAWSPSAPSLCASLSSCCLSALS